MSHRTAVINLVALTEREAKHMPRLTALMSSGSQSVLHPTLPAVTCTSQSTMLTGTTPAQHGIVGNGWHDRARAETRFWQQSNRLVNGEKVWDRLAAQDASITTANCFWWFAMYSAANITVTPRPQYPADGRKIPDVWTQPSGLRDELQQRLGRFPLFKFWGPAADISSSQWIADTAKHVDQTLDPTLLLAYLPHLDYGLQKFGPDHADIPKVCRELDDVAADLIESLMANGRRILLVNEYGITAVTDAVAPNRILRSAGFLALRMEQGRELLDAGASAAFAVPDHQIAHVYLADPTQTSRVADLFHTDSGIDRVLHGEAIESEGLSHKRCGDLVLVAARDRWFCHDWWTDEKRAPDYQRTVDIHRKPGYDPRELFVDPAITFPRTSIGWRLFRRQLGMRTLMDVIPLDTSLVRGSHGRNDPDLDPLLWCSESLDLPKQAPMSLVSSLIESLVAGR
ncbi:MAG: alkaline phosphatase family protein [Planctomycetes bacterium]|nr:alkaline phosphatase family protein [Planctomycetota bacterium]